MTNIMPETVITPNILHAWLYSVVPTGNPQHPVYLVAYCRNCDNSYSKEIELLFVDFSEGLLARAGVPRFGCTDPYAGL